MTPATDVRVRIDELVDELNEHSYRYHVLDAPIIDDAGYDTLFRELQQLEADHPEHVREDAAHGIRRAHDDGGAAARDDPVPGVDEVLPIRLPAGVDDGLGARQRAVIVLHDVEGFKHAEIGSMLGIPEGTARSDLHHARAQLRRVLGDIRGDL